MSFASFDPFQGASATGTGSQTAPSTAPGTAWEVVDNLIALGIGAPGGGSWFAWLAANPGASAADIYKAAGLSPSGGTTPSTPNSTDTLPLVGPHGGPLGPLLDALDTIDAEVKKGAVGVALYLLLAVGIFAVVWPGQGSKIIKGALK